MSGPEPYTVTFTPAARRRLGKLSFSAATALYEHLVGPVAANPHRLGKPLEVPFEDVLSTRRGEYRALITGRYRRAWVHSDATIDALTLDAIGHVPWWPPDRNEVTLHHILVRLATDTSRHAGQADIVRELIDGTAGRTRKNTNLSSADQAWWQAHRDQVELAAREAANASSR